MVKQKVVQNIKTMSELSRVKVPQGFLKQVQYMEKFPEALKNYVKRCYLQCKSANDEEIVTKHLMDKINLHTAKGSINKHNWADEALVPTTERIPDPPKKDDSYKERNKKENHQKRNNGKRKNNNHGNSRQEQKLQNNNFPTQKDQGTNLQLNQGYYQQSQGYYQQNYLYGNQVNNQQNYLYGNQVNNQQNYQYGNQGNNQQNYQYGNQGSNQQNYQYGNQGYYQQNQGNNQQNYQYGNQGYYQQNQGNNQQNYQYGNQGYYQQNQGNGQQNYQYGNQGYYQQPPNYQNTNQDYYKENNNQYTQNYQEVYDENKERKQYNQQENQEYYQQIQRYQNSSYQQTNQILSETKDIDNKEPIFNNPKFNNYVNSNSYDNNKTQLVHESNPKDKNMNSNSIITNNKNKVNQNKHASDDSLSLNAGHIVGTSTAMEKEYLRLAGSEVPDASLFRPLPILVKSFEYCLNKYSQNNDYEYISEQLRSIRQDLLVQGIEDEFCVSVYEKHATLAIKNEDWGNFNQSMTSLEKLYSRGLGEFEHICEFFHYRIIYLIGVDDILGLYSFIPRIPSHVLMSQPIKNALEIWKCYSNNEWAKYFEIMNNSTELSKSVMKFKAKELRITAFSSIFKGFRKLSIQEIQEFLFFNSENEAREFLQENDIQIPE